MNIDKKEINIDVHEHSDLSLAGAKTIIGRTIESVEAGVFHLNLTLSGGLVLSIQDSSYIGDMSITIEDETI